MNMNVLLSVFFRLQLSKWIIGKICSANSGIHTYCYSVLKSSPAAAAPSSAYLR